MITRRGSRIPPRRVTPRARPTHRHRAPQDFRLRTSKEATGGRSGATPNSADLLLRYLNHGRGDAEHTFQPLRRLVRGSGSDLLTSGTRARGRGQEGQRFYDRCVHRLGSGEPRPLPDRGMVGCDKLTLAR